ncbi:MFS transporter [Pelagicoccus sp. SDUM812002]|uniref:MFS transporter n=1 Tax=Pelagicoccus sp. SDUM812002 TaxID=3041266 RepID=UPI00280D07AD|nr:MFS transporter [Pelagicoccus sp. SDUM812002]MDQ8188223.1 MFS transporter [Pelagicoccus sp. SDUM812002]
MSKPPLKTSHEDRIPISRKLTYGMGALANNLLGAAIGMMSIVLITGLKMNPAVVGALMAIPRLTDALTDPLMGYISDHTKSRWGRRKPYIFAGAILSGVIFAFLWQLPAGHSESFYFWYFLGGSILFYLAYTVFATPWVAMGYELTPDYNERTRLMGVANFIGQFAWVAVPWFYAIMENDALFEDAVAGARGLAIAIGVFVAIVGVLPALFCKERFKEASERGAVAKESPLEGLAKNALNFGKGFLITIRFPPFLKLCGATFLVFNGFMLVSAFSSYVIIYYIFSGDQDLGAEYIGWFGTVSSISTFCVIFLVTWISTRIGKRQTFFLATGVSIVGYGLKWFCYNPDHPNLLLLPAPLIAFGLGGLFTLMGSMVADVCDLDEIATGERREGMFGSIFWWVVKLGMALALALSGILLNATGFEVELEGDQTERALLLMRVFDFLVPMVTSGIAIWIIATYRLTEEKALEVRNELERRRTTRVKNCSR